MGTPRTFPFRTLHRCDREHRTNLAASARFMTLGLGSGLPSGCVVVTRIGRELRMEGLDGFTPEGLGDLSIGSSRKGRLRQLLEQLAADAIEPPFFHDVEIGIYTDRFVEGQLPLPHMPNVGAVQVR